MQQWVSAAKAGEQAAWSVLHKQYYPALLANALRICGTTPAAKDAVQDTFITAYLKLDQLKDPSAFGGWLKKILLHTCYRMKQQHKHTTALPHITESWWDDEITRKLDEANSRNRLHATIASLPETLRSTLMLRYFSGFQSYEDIAQVLSVPIGTVRSRLNQAKSKLSEHWQQQTDAGVHIFRQGEEWNRFYGYTFGEVHHSDDAKNKFMRHLQKDLELVYTSGKTAAGREFIEKEIEEDRRYGSWFELVNITSSGNISVIEALNINSVEYPDRCPPTAVFVLHRQKEKAIKVNLHLK